MKVKVLRIGTYLGLDELDYAPGKINIFRGPMGVGKSSILEAIEKAFTNKDRRTEVIKHGETEATIFVETDTGLEINRKLRNNKADYFKLRKGEEGISSTEKYLKALVNGNIFRPIDWVNMPVQEQTKSILNMLQINWTKENITEWFGELTSNIEYSQHILMVLKAIEIKYFKDREEVNRKIKELKTQVQVIKKDMPVDYDGENWRNKKVQEYYKKVLEGQDINKWINEAEALKENFKSKVAAIQANGDSEQARVQMKFKDHKQDIKDIMDMSQAKIDKAKVTLIETDADQDNNINRSYEKYQQTINELDKEYEKKRQDLKLVLQTRDEQIRSNILKDKEELNEIIQLQTTKIATKEQELISIDDLEVQALAAVEVKGKNETEKEQLRVGKAATYLDNNELVEIEPLQQKADEVANMQSYLRQWDNLIDIRDNKLSAKERETHDLTAKIEKARTLPGELLKTAQMPIQGISVDEKGLIRINKTLIDGLSDGEKLELAMTIAKAQAGDLQVICIDKFESLNATAQKKLLEEMKDDTFQYFITETADTVGGNNISIQKID